MKELVECLQQWLNEQHDEVLARELAIALVGETLKCISSADVTQRDFDAQALAAAARWPEADDFDAAKRKVDRANLPAYTESRRARIEEFYRSRAKAQALRIVKRSSPGRHRAQWALESYDLPVDAPSTARLAHKPTRTLVEPSPGVITYDLTPAGEVRPSWLGRLVLGNGKFRTRSFRGVLWAGSFVVVLFVVLFFAFVIWSMLYSSRPVQARDLALLFITIGLSWYLSVETLRPYLWLVDDRIVRAPSALAAWNEDPAQLEMFKEEDHRIVGLVRYTAVCSICAAGVELRYGYGENRRRLFGRCMESPQEHVFTFDRVTREGRLRNEQWKP